nr:hypothetical protein [Tanacetum cinerariifolium]
KNQGDVNDALGYKKKAVVVTSDPLALVAEKTNVNNRKEKFKVQTESEGSDDKDISDLKKITALLAKAFNRKKYYTKPTNNNLRTSSTSSSANKKPEYDQAWMESDSDSDQEINANMVSMAQIERFFQIQMKVLHPLKKPLLSENHIDSQKDYDKSEVDHNAFEEKEHLVDKLIQKFNHKIAKLNTFEEQNNKFNEQMKLLNEKNVDLLAQTEVLQDQLKVKHVVIDTHTECQAQYAKLEEERYEYMIKYSALCDNDKQHRKKIDEQEILFDKMSRKLVEMNNNVLRLS